jgi:predicted dehydrogenase
MINIGIIGYGYWGPNLVRNFMSVDTCEVKVVIDSRTERLELVKSLYPSVDVLSNVDELYLNTEINAVVIATSVFSHYALAKRALLEGKHVLIEKPMTSSSVEAQELIGLAKEKGLTLMVDHTFLYTGAVQKMQELIKSGTVGRPQYFDSARINLGLFQADVNVLWDLAPHDISILNFLVDEQPISVNATGVSHTGNGIENIAYMTLNYESDFIAHFNCSWSSPVKLRQTLIGGDKKMLVYNDLEPSDKIRVYDTGYSHQTDEEKKNVLVDYRTGDVFIPKLSNLEALKGVAMDFVNSIRSGKEPVSTAEIGLSVVKILEAAQKSIKNNGVEVML